MPSYAAQFSGTPYKEKKLAAIVEYIKSLDNHGPGGKPKYYRPLPPATETGDRKTGGRTAGRRQQPEPAKPAAGPANSDSPPAQEKPTP